MSCPPSVVYDFDVHRLAFLAALLSELLVLRALRYFVSAMAHIARGSIPVGMFLPLNPFCNWMRVA
jgi:ABC-type Mn2+/Zn2+ transport system permease subunit